MVNLSLMKDKAQYIDLLNETHTWPVEYLFKFIAKKEFVDQVLEIFPNEEISTNKSKNGNYISFSMKKIVRSAEEVLEIYELIQTIEGVISL